MVIDTDHRFKGKREFGYSKCSKGPGYPLNDLDRAPGRPRLQLRETYHTKPLSCEGGDEGREYGEYSGGEERTKGGRREPGQQEAKGPCRQTTPADVKVMVQKQTAQDEVPAIFQIQIFSSAHFTSARLLLVGSDRCSISLNRMIYPILLSSCCTFAGGL